jgi:hypothetical protein
MPELFNELRERLLRAGVAPRHVRRYLDELADHLEDLRAEGERAGLGRPDAEAAALARLGQVDDLARAMTERRQFQSWFARAPWIAFGLAPLVVLASAYLFACLILWSGWRMFLPGTNSPFVTLPVDGLANLYFGVGRSVYFAAPIVIGCVISLIAARQRLRAVWPVVGIVVIALIGSAARVHADLPANSGGIGHVSMGFSFGPSLQSVSNALLHAAVTIAVSLLPYFLLRMGRGRRVPNVPKARGH